MPQFWLVSWTPDNFKIFQDKGYRILGIPENRKSVAHSIHPGDKAVIYTLKEQSLRAICDCTSEYFYSEERIWSDGIYPHRLHTRLLVEGKVDYKAVRNQLEISQKGKLPPGLELRGGYKRLSSSDYQIIETNFQHIPPSSTQIKETQTPVKYEKPAASHHDLINIMKNIGTLLGKVVEEEWRGPEYKHDIAWKDKEFLMPSTVIEVSDNGALEKDILALEWASYNLEATAILVTINDGDFAKAKQSIPASSKIIVVKSDGVRKLHELL